MNFGIFLAATPKTKPAASVQRVCGAKVSQVQSVAILKERNKRRNKKRRDES